MQALAHRALEQSANGGRSLEVIASLRSALDDLAEAGDTFAAARVADFLTAEITAPLWVCEPLVAGGGISFLFSPPGVGKSLLSFELARCVARGEPFLGRFNTTGGPAIVFNLEMAAPQFQHRLRLFEHHHPVGDAALYLVSESLALTDSASFARFRALCESIGPAMVVVDPLIRAMPGVKLNLAEEVGPALAPIADLARTMGFALLAIHHTRKDGGRAGLDSLADSRDFAARADIALLMQAVGEDGLLRVTCEKTRWGDPPPPFCLRIESDPKGYPAILPAEAPNAKNEVLELLAMQSPLTTGEILAELEGVKSRPQVNRALKDLHEAGCIQRVRRGLWALPETSENRGGER
ncbi:MAG TPA: AAA family ATPase [Armatimonadota bacterium]|nr:AAA family ATPase [Armatimonadota bacterium]